MLMRGLLGIRQIYNKKCINYRNIHILLIEGIYINMDKCEAVFFVFVHVWCLGAVHGYSDIVIPWF
jgi:hypothetical protein